MKLVIEKRDILVGAKGFEPSTPASRTQCATGLRYAPTGQASWMAFLERNRIVLHQRVETQAMRFGHAAAGDFALREIHALRQSCIGTDRRIYA